MKKVVLAIIISLFGTLTLGALLDATPAVYAQKRDDRTKDPPGPPVQRDKKGDHRPSNPPPKKDRRP
ncbi:MAG: hypothetical protein V7641_5126 [Blastocatellia bacterium]